jgi:hypothetical protein
LLLLFSLAGGYAFLQVCQLTKHRWDAQEWERNLFEAALAGAALFVAIRLAAPILGRFAWLVRVRDGIRIALPHPFAASFLGALALALALAWLVNRLVPRERAIRHAVERHGGELLILLQHAAQHALPVSLTMGNRKVYVGFVLAPPSLKYPHTSILPTITGHREESTLQLVFDTAYWPVYKDLRRRREQGESIGVDVEHFAIVLPVAQIRSANLFDDNTYARYFDAARPSPAGGAAGEDGEGVATASLD